MLPKELGNFSSIKQLSHPTLLARSIASGNIYSSHVYVNVWKLWAIPIICLTTFFVTLQHNFLEKVKRLRAVWIIWICRTSWRYASTYRTLGEFNDHPHSWLHLLLAVAASTQQFHNCQNAYGYKLAVFRQRSQSFAHNVCAFEWDSGREAKINC